MTSHGDHAGMRRRCAGRGLGSEAGRGPCRSWGGIGDDERDVMALSGDEPIRQE